MLFITCKTCNNDFPGMAGDSECSSCRCPTREENQPLPATKLVEVRLSAFTRVEYMEVVEVPANITQAELDDLVNARYRQVDGGEFTSDPEYWERGTCEAVVSDMPNAVPSMMAFMTAHGLHIERADAAAQTVESSGPTP